MQAGWREAIMLLAIVGGAFAMIQLVIAEHFAGQAHGKILGIFTFVDTIAGALGTQVIGLIRIGAESYIPAINLMIIACVGATLCVFAINRLTKRPMVLADNA